MAENDYAKLSTLGKVENIAGENKLRLKNGWWATLTSRAKNCHCERSEAIFSTEIASSLALLAMTYLLR